MAEKTYSVHRISCDRCGRTEDFDQREGQEVNPDTWRTVCRWSPRHTQQLCPGCTGEFEAWWKARRGSEFWTYGEARGAGTPPDDRPGWERDPDHPEAGRFYSKFWRRPADPAPKAPAS